MAIIREDIRTHIDAITSPWRSFRQKPPFTAKQLIAAALLSQDAPLSTADIFSWIIMNFDYYKELAVYLFMASGVDRQSPYPAARDLPPVSLGDQAIPERLRGKIRHALKSYDFPVEVDQNYIQAAENYRLDYRGTWYEIEESRIQPRFTMIATNAERLFRLYLARSDKAGQRQAFRFLDLPEDIRKYVYELVFGYPRSGLGVIVANESYGFYKQPKKSFIAFVHEFSKNFSLATWQILRSYPLSSGWDESTVHHGTQPGFIVHTQSISQILSPLLVNRQIYQEAAQFFYYINHFHCDDIVTLRNFLLAMHPKRRQHLGRLSTTLGNNTTEGDIIEAHEVFKLMGDISFLYAFYLRVTPKFNREIEASPDWASFMPATYMERSVSKPWTKALGLHEPGLLRIGELYIEGCQRLEGWIRDAMGEKKLHNVDTAAFTFSQ